MKQLALLVLLFSFSSFAVQEFTFSVAAFSSTVKDLGAEDIESSNQPAFSVGYKWFIGTKVHLLLSVDNRKYKLDFEDSNVTGDKEISLQRFDAGIRLVMTPKTAVSIFASKAEILDFNIQGNQIELLSEEMSFYSVNLNQVLMQFRPFNVGFDISYDFQASKGDIEDRTQMSGRLYSIIGRSAHRARLFAGLELEDKTIEGEEVKSNNTIFGIEYIFRF
jgi:hypothetical protein